MLRAHSQPPCVLFVPVLAFVEDLFQPTHLVVVGIIALLLFGRYLPRIAYWLGKKLVELRFRGIRLSIRKMVAKIKKGLRRRDDEEPGACLARLEPPDKPRPPAQVALTPAKSSED